MNKIKLYIAVFLSALIYYGCDKPVATELIEDNQVEIEVLSQDLEDEFYSNGFDSTGVTIVPLQFTNIITVSGIKTSNGRKMPARTSFAQAVFFDKNFPVTTRDGKLLGYRTRTPGIVRFNNILAREELYNIRFRGNTGPVDTILGFRYVLNGGRGMHSDPFNFDYGSTVKFEYIPASSTGPYVLNIPVPGEVSAAAKVTGSFAESNLAVLLEWNGNRSDNFEVVISGINARDDLFPLYRIKTEDDGNLIIPSSLINRIPRDQFKNLDFSLIRKIEINSDDGPVELHVLSQSIHRIILDSP